MTVAAAAGVREIVFATSRELVPSELDPDPVATGRLIGAVASVLPGIARRGDSGLSTNELTVPFRTYLAAATG
jgi:hypothetical protein